MKPSQLLEQFISIRASTEAICKLLKTEDYSVQPCDFVSPPKWHLAHSTWFFEQFILVNHFADYKVFNPDFTYLFNSYYNNLGTRVLRPNRGLMTRPTVNEVYSYRTYVNQNVKALLQDSPSKEVLQLIEIGLQHEQQHQELLYYDIKYILGHQPTFPVYKTNIELDTTTEKPKLINISEGLYKIGHKGNDFCFDNELGQHQVFLQQYSISNLLVINQDYIEFIEDKAYQNFNLWHSDGWDFINSNHIKAPLYWHKIDGQWHYYTLQGFKAVALKKPVNHISYYEAFAFAEWKGLRLPTEFEWEIASPQLKYKQLWEWTNSAYLPYPKFLKAKGALGEYNGKFMVNQMVMRGASIATPKEHSRPTYRNFFHPNMRWMFSGIRLAK